MIDLLSKILLMDGFATNGRCEASEGLSELGGKIEELSRDIRTTFVY